MNLNENIVKLRKELKLSQEELAEKMQVSRQTISNWELNETTPDAKQLVKLAKTFNITVDELLNNDSKKIIASKISNTEKLACLNLKMVKIVIIILSFILFLILAYFILTTVFKYEQSDNENEYVNLKCVIDEKEYKMTIGDKDYFVCDTCSNKMKIFLTDLTDWANLDNSIKNVTNYFIENGGTCTKLAK